MINLETLNKISSSVGRNVSICSCDTCKSQCTRCSCLGTPGDIKNIIDAGFADRLSPTIWMAGIIMGATKLPVPMVQAKFIPGSGCTFFKNGLCELHNLGLKPTEGKLSHHTVRMENIVPKLNLTWNVAKEWLTEEGIEMTSMFMNKDENKQRYLDTHL